MYVLVSLEQGIPRDENGCGSFGQSRGLVEFSSSILEGICNLSYQHRYGATYPPRRQMLKGILFDLDGTLLDSLPMTFLALDQTFQRLGEGVRTREEVTRAFGHSERIILAQCLGVSPDSARAAEAARIYQEALTKLLHSAPLHDEVSDLLSHLRKMRPRLPLGIVTGRGRTATHTLLKHHGLSETFQVVVAHEDALGRSKPDPTGVLLATEQLGLGLVRESVLYLGDMPMDLGAARNGGLKSGLARWDRTQGLNRPEWVWTEEAHRHADFLFESPLEVLKVLQT
jgi:phosphoglycolate phosphatase-like HAD superfamily hydrolase